MKTALFALLSLVLLAGAAAQAPITLEATYEETGEQPRIRRLLHVTGRTRYPDGTRLAVGIHQEDEPDRFFAWYQTLTKGQAFVVEMGWKKPLASGAYVVEARCAADRQPPPLAAQLRELEKKDPAFDQARGPDGSVRGECRVQVGSPEAGAREREESRRLFTRVHADLEAVFRELEAARSAGKTVPSTEALAQRVQAADLCMSDFRAERVTIQHHHAARAVAEVVIALQGLLGDSFSTPEEDRRRAQEGLAAILAEVGPPPAEKPPEK